MGDGSGGWHGEDGGAAQRLPRENDGGGGFAHGCWPRIFMPPRTAGGRHCPRWPIGMWHLVTLPLTRGPHAVDFRDSGIKHENCIPHEKNF
jgi:hypothetical protein